MERMADLVSFRSLLLSNVPDGGHGAGPRYAAGATSVFVAHSPEDLVTLSDCGDLTDMHH